MALSYFDWKPEKAQKIVVIKHKRKMVLYSHFMPIREYRVALGKNPIGPKMWEGDNRTPEGRYYIDSKLAKSRYHLALRVSYPNPYDLAQAKRHGWKPGHSIMIHGLDPEREKLGRNHIRRDWTNGCVAVTNREIEEIWELVDVGTLVEIVP